MALNTRYIGVAMRIFFLSIVQKHFVDFFDFFLNIIPGTPSTGEREVSGIGGPRR